MTTAIAPLPVNRFDGADLDRAHADWGCNCGPAALAACLGWSLDEVRPHLGEFERRGFMSPSMMLAAIASAGFRTRPIPASSPDSLPAHGLLRVQWGGPWLAPGVPPKAAYRYTHWIACKRFGGPEDVAVFDVNCPAWQPMARWQHGTAIVLMDAVKRCDRTFGFTHRWEVRRS